MTIDPTNVGGSSAGLIDRIKNILLTPGAEWDKIATEPTDVQKLYSGYALPLLVLSALCAFIGTTFIGIMGIRIGIVPGLVGVVLQVALGAVGLFLLAVVTNALAPTFGSQPDMGQAHKLAVYGSTAGLLAGVFTIVPALAILGLVGLYSLYLIWVGLPKMMKTPEDKRLGYFLAVIVVCIIAQVVLVTLVSSVRATMMGAPTYTYGQTQTPQSARGEVTLPGGGTVDMAALEQQAAAMQSGAPAIDPSRLEAQLPRNLPGGFALVSNSTATAAGAANAEGVYQNGDARIRVTITHMGAMGALASVAQAANVQQSSRNADGFTRTNTVDGRVITEDVSTSRGMANYAVVGRGIAVTAEGSGGVSLDQVRAVVETINVARLENIFD